MGCKRLSRWSEPAGMIEQFFSVWLGLSSAWASKASHKLKRVVGPVWEVPSSPARKTSQWNFACRSLQISTRGNVWLGQPISKFHSGAICTLWAANIHPKSWDWCKTTLHRNFVTGWKCSSTSALFPQLSLSDWLSKNDQLFGVTFSGWFSAILVTTHASNLQVFQFLERIEKPIRALEWTKTVLVAISWIAFVSCCEDNVPETGFKWSVPQPWVGWSVPTSEELTNRSQVQQHLFLQPKLVVDASAESWVQVKCLQRCWRTERPGQSETQHIIVLALWESVDDDLESFVFTQARLTERCVVLCQLTLRTRVRTC